MNVTVTHRNPPRIFYGWYIVGASVALNFYLSIAFFQGFQVFFLPILTEFGWSRALTSGAYSLRQLESGFLAPVVGFLVDKWGPRTVILLSVLCTGAGLMLLSTIHSIGSFYLALMVASIGTSGASHGITWPVAVAAWFKRLQARAFGIAMLGPVFAGPFLFIVALMEQQFGWRVSLFILGAGLWIVGIPLALVVRSDPRRYGYLPDGDAPESAKTAQLTTTPTVLSGTTQEFTTRQAVRTRAFWLLSAILGLQFLAMSGITVHLIPLLQDINYTPASAASILGAVFLLSGIGRLGAGVVADMVSQRTVMIGLLVAQAVALLLLSSTGSHQYIRLGLFALLFGIGFGGMVPLRPYLTRRLFGLRSFGAIQGLVQGVSVATSVLGPIAYGRVFDVTQSYDIAIYGSVAVLLLAVPLVLALRLPPE